MNNFSFCSPTRFIFGRGEEARVGEYAASFGAKKVLVLHYGTGQDFENQLVILLDLSKNTLIIFK